MSAGSELRKRIPYKRTPYKRWPLKGVTKHISIRHKILLYLTMAVVFIYLGWRIFFTMPFRFGLLSSILGIILLLAEMASFTVTLSNFREATHYVVPYLPPIPEDWYPEVDVFVTTHNEEVELLYRTLNGCTFMEYPDKSKVHIWLCDDNNRQEMKDLADSLGVGYIGMEEKNKHAKAGNLNNALNKTSAPLVVTFDADMIPKEEFLTKIVPYFFLPKMEVDEEGTWRILEEDEIDEEYKIGFIQSPQSFYNPDLFQYNLYSERNIPNEQDYFFTQVNVAKNNDNISSYAGSNTMLSREALETVGGFAWESITEDFLTGLMILQAGYRNLAIPDQLAHGLCPETISSFVSQRDRWTRGNIQCFRLVRVWTSRTLNFWQKFELTGSLCYWFGFLGRLVFILSPIIAVLFKVQLVNTTIFHAFIFSLPVYVLYYFSTRILSDNTRSNHWSHVVDTIMAPYLSMPAILETIGFKQKKFVVTDKSKSKDIQQWRKFLYTIPHALLLILNLITVAFILYQSITTTGLYNPIVLFWLLSGTKDLIFAIFFMMGRTNYRNAERYYVKMPVTVRSNDLTHEGETADISHTGMSVVFSQPINSRPDSIVEITVGNEEYSATMKCRVANVNRRPDDAGGGYKYGFIIEDIDEENKRQFYQIVYNRAHPLPKTFKKSSSVFDDVRTNIQRRTKKTVRNYRKMPRFIVDMPFRIDGGSQGVLMDFNYEFAKLKMADKVEPTDIITLEWEGKLKLILTPASNSEIQDLYQVINYKELLGDAAFIPLVEKWQGMNQRGEANKPIGTGVITQI
ncbi:cellulose synthase (UDP-forming) [Aequitasia blattaphilus]|uniref:Glycosyltransferase n=1 Tax=Aequitasia blattaphilus TaxID=2949332 RepID=A0ABT1E7U3_9FIRM|nr:glycosyltransferase family 2 protein [Aequitasia blattaphilus]MCP1101057.1 glycosyltransferase [Aequitasia blattaphilus]MCR8613697.1 glycosyltransferase [Aequitasia blattaphilus]